MTLLKTGKNQLDNVIFVKDEWVDWRERDYHYLITQATQANIQLKFIEPTGNSHLFAFELAHIENISALFISSFETAKLIHNVFYFSDKPLPKIYTFYRNSFNDDNRFIQYSLDYGYISQQLLAKKKK